MKTSLKKAFAILALVLLLANIAVWQMVFVQSRQSQGGVGELTVAFLDIGQGDSIFIQAPNGNQVLVDGGPTAKVLSQIGGLMPWYDKTLDMIVITNPDKDHIAGFVDVLRRYDVEYVLEPGTKNKSLVNTEVHELATMNGVKTILARRGMEIVLDPSAGVSLTVLFPDRDVSQEEPNDGSIVMRLTYGQTEVMLTGDAPSQVEKYLLSLQQSSNLRLESDILKIGHHGSKTSTAPEFVRAVNPQYAIISSGKENKYGHPNQETLSTLSQFPLEVLRTDTLGTIVFKSDGKNLSRLK